MPIVSPFAQYSFLTLVAIVAVAFVLGFRRTGGRQLIAPTIVALWLGVSALLAKSGYLQRFDQAPPPFLLFAGGYALATAVLAFSPIGTRLASGLDIRWLVGFQAFRLPLELLLHRLYQEGVIPVQMTYAGRNFDIITGILAIAIFVWAKPPRWAIWAFNLIGLVLLINIVTIAILSAPTPLRQFWNEPANTFVAYLPFVWLPAFLVQAAWFGHLLVFRWLRQSR